MRVLCHRLSYERIIVESKDKISEKWPWNGEFLRLFLLMPSAIGISFTLATIPFVGIQASWFLTAICIGIVLNLIYGTVGRKVEALKIQHSSKSGDIAEALIVIGKIQSPGIVILQNSKLELIPIVGKIKTISLTDTELIGEGRWLPGKYVWGKHVFKFKVPEVRPLAFAVPKSFGSRWSKVIHDHGRMGNI